MKTNWIVIVEEYGKYYLIKEELTEEDWYDDGDEMQYLYEKHQGLEQMGSRLMFMPEKEFIKLALEVGPLNV